MPDRPHSGSRAGGDAALAGFVACRKRAPFFVRSWSLATDDCDAADGAAAASVMLGCSMARPPPRHRRDAFTRAASVTFDAVDAS